MVTIEGYPEGSMGGQYLKWGRANEYAPAFVFDETSETAIRAVQQHLLDVHPEANLTAKLHATVMYCPPRSLFEAVWHLVGWKEPSVRQEIQFYSDVANGFETATLFSVESLEMPVEGLEMFDEAHGLVAMKLARTAFLSEWRVNVVELLRYNLREYYGLGAAQFDTLAESPTFQWLFRPSHPHITVAKNVHVSATALGAVPLPATVTLGGLRPDSPLDFVGFNSLLFDPDAAFEPEGESA